MTDNLENTAPKDAAGCTPPPRRVWAQALGAAVLALIVACGEVKLIEQAAVSGATCGIGTQGSLARVVDSSLASGFAPIAILR